MTHAEKAPETDYLHHRMVQETEAAIGAADARSTAIHVQLAQCYASQLIARAGVADVRGRAH